MRRVCVCVRVRVRVYVCLRACSSVGSPVPRPSFLAARTRGYRAERRTRPPARYRQSKNYSTLSAMISIRVSSLQLKDTHAPYLYARDDSRVGRARTGERKIARSTENEVEKSSRAFSTIHLRTTRSRDGSHVLPAARAMVSPLLSFVSRKLRFSLCHSPLLLSLSVARTRTHSLFLSRVKD